ncbi:hypothetical protein RF11_15149 [Thelohanellus kitauei]|uniref:Coiled-coil domain-containing protein 153 n=1 Tax=Thelohanellus kitauei TaxID=669202 RepID=A0A0C2J658_THEKT|nr:hypothetical protein RF11_15149 [Thelohanellus kitauei]
MPRATKTLSSAKKINRLKQQIEIASSNHDEEINKFQEEQKLLFVEIEHQEQLIIRFDKDIVESRSDMKKLEKEVMQDFSRKYSKTLAQLEDTIKDKDNTYKKLLSELQDFTQSRIDTEKIKT